MINRDLFPRDAFEIRLCDVNSEQPWSHKAWASGKVKAGGDDSIPLYVLDRAKDYGAQKFVDWIVSHLTIAPASLSNFFVGCQL